MKGNKIKDVKAFCITRDNTPPDDAVEALRRDGVVCLRNAFRQEWMNVIEQGIDQALSGASTDLDIVQRDGDAGSFSVSSHAWREVEPFREFIFESHLADIAWAMLETTQLVLFYDFLLIKEPRSDNAATPWHQDHSYYPLDGTKAINCWVALDNIPKESALRFMKGSHRPATLFRAVNFDEPRKDYRHARKDLPMPPDAAGSDMPILASAMSPGDMLIWKSYTLHSAPGNRLDRRRAALSVNWVGDEIVYNAKPSLETYRDSTLTIGKPIVCKKFPLVRCT